MNHSDILTGLDMVVAISQATVNYQFQQLHNQGILHDQVTIGSDDSVKLIATTDAPTVSFAVPDSNRSVMFKVPFPSGTISYWLINKGIPKRMTYSFTNWVYAFKVNMDMQGISNQAIQEKTTIPQIVKDHLIRFNDSMFTIQHLFLDFENADLADFDVRSSTITIPPDVPKDQKANFFQQVGSIMSDYFKALQGSDNPYILGYSIEAKAGNYDKSPTFTPTSCSFSTFNNGTNGNLNALNFLIKTNYQPLPQRPDLGLFASNWLNSNENDGKFVLASSLFWDKWFLNKIKNDLTLASITQTNNGWDLSYTNTYTYKNPCGLKEVLTGHCYETDDKTTKDNSASVSFDNENTNIGRINLTANWHHDFNRSGHVALGAYEEMYAGAKKKLNAKLKISVGNAEIGLEKESWSSPDADKYTGGNWVGKMDIALISGNQDILDGVSNSAETQMNAMLTSFQQGLNGIANHLVLPAGEVFFFKNVQFDTYGNLVMDITYKSIH